MNGHVTALALLLLLGAEGMAGATTVTLDFSNPTNGTVNVKLITTNADGAVKNVNVGGRNAVQTGGGTGGFLYVGLPKDVFANSRAVWASVEYYDQGADMFWLAFDGAGAEMNITENPVAKHDTKAWLTHTFSLPGFKFTEGLPGGADLKLDDFGDGPEVIGKITVTDEDPIQAHWPHVDPAHPIKIDGVITPGEWDDAHQVTVDTPAQNALAAMDWGGPSDFSGTYYHKWDESGIYVRGDVTDATPRLNTETGDRAWNGDGIEEFLGFDWSNPVHITTRPLTDFNLFIGLGDSPQWGVQYAGSGGTLMEDNLGAVPIQNLAIRNTDTPKGYQFELFIPWRLLLDRVKNVTTQIEPGQKIGWFMFANNSKVSPSNQDVAMSPYGRTHPWDNPSVWSTVVLGPVPAQPATVSTPPTAGP